VVTEGSTVGSCDGVVDNMVLDVLIDPASLRRHYPDRFLRSAAPGCPAALSARFGASSRVCN
jgi:hypothetical protein